MNTLTREQIERILGAFEAPDQIFLGPDGVPLSALCDMALRSEAQPVGWWPSVEAVAIARTFFYGAAGLVTAQQVAEVCGSEVIRIDKLPHYASPPPPPAPEVAELVNTLNAWADATEAGTCVLDRLDQATELRQAASALSARRVGEEALKVYAAFFDASEVWRKLPWYKDGRNDAEREAVAEQLDVAHEAVIEFRLAGVEHG